MRSALEPRRPPLAPPLGDVFIDAPRAPAVATGSGMAHLLAGAMLVSMPLVAFQGPGNTTVMDAVNVLFVAVSWVYLLARRERIAFPLALPCWIILVASCLALYTAELRDRAAYVLVVDVYLYVWFVTLAHFLGRRCDPGKVAVMWTGVAALVALLTLADANLGLLGGFFAGDKRATGTFENPNMFGNFLVVSFFVAWAAASARRPLVYLALPVMIAGVLSTASNGALVSLSGGLAAVAISHRGFWRTQILGPVLVVGAIVLAVGGLWHEEIQVAVMQQLSGSRGEIGGAALKGASERLPIWETVFAHVLEVPTGVGPGNFSAVNAAATGDYHGAHNEYLGMLAERGVLGLLGWFAFLAAVLAMLLRIRAGAEAGFAPLGVGPLFGLFGACTAHALVVELSHFRHFWMVLAVLAATAMQATRARDA